MAANRITILAAILAGTLLVMTGCYFLPSEKVIHAPPLIDPPAKTYTTIEAKKGSILLQITGRGIYESLSASDVYYDKYGGYLKNIHVKAGDTVKKGDLLVELDSESLKLKIKQLQMQVDAEEAAYKQLKITGTMDMESAKKRLDDLKEEYKEALTVPEAYSSEELDSMENMIMKQGIELHKLELAYGTDGQGNEGYELDRASATLAVSKERLKEMQDELDFSQCFSPIDGVVVYRTDVKMGEYIDTFRSLLRIADTGDVHLVYEEMNSDKSVYFETGMKVKVERDGNVFDGEVVKTRKELMEDFNEGKITVSTFRAHGYDIVIKVSDLDGKARLGDSYNVVLELQKKEDVIILPNNAIFADGERKYVHVLVDGIKYERDVEVGMVTATESEIVKGLQEGEKVVVR